MSDQVSELVTVTIDGVEVSVPKGTLVIRAAEQIGIDIPRFCDHPLLAPVGACRQCLVDVPDAGNGRGFPKPQASCTLPVAPGMVVETQATSGVAEKAQKGNLEFLLANHPLDCPVCDKGGECPLQNQAMSHGNAEARFAENKRTFAKPVEVSAQVLLDRERCVLCQRCTRFSQEIAGDPFIALVERGAKQQIGIADEEPFHSYFSGNTIQICPVGALTSADYRFRARPFDLVSTPSIAEHDSCGAAIRIDHRRGKVMRRLAGDDPEVNEEWITDKDRFAFSYTRLNRLQTPLVRDPKTGEMEPASWPAAIAAAARGLAAASGRVGVLTGGRLPVEDAFAYSVFARKVLGTHDIDFRARAQSAEETEFLAAVVAGSQVLSYAEIEAAPAVVLIGLEPEDEAGTLFLRLLKAANDGLPVTVVGSHLSRGSQKLDADLIETAPGAEAAAVVTLDVPKNAVLLVGERLATAPGALSAVAAKAAASGSRLAWVPRRAGDRGAVEAGALPNLLPGGRPVSSPEARIDATTALGIDWVPPQDGRDTYAILSAAYSGDLSALVVAGVEVADIPGNVRGAFEKAFVVSLEVRESEVTAVADVVLPVAATVEKAGSFVNWQGLTRSFGQVLDVPGVVSDTEVLARIAGEMGKPLGFSTTAEAAEVLADLGTWDGERAVVPSDAPAAGGVPEGRVLVSTWRQMIDDGRGQDGRDEYAATARPAVLRASAATLGQFTHAKRVSLATEFGSASFDVEVADLPTGVVWVPGNSGVNIAGIGLQHGAYATLGAGGLR